LKVARRAYRLSYERPLTVDDMPCFKTYSTPTLILVYLLLAAFESDLPAALGSGDGSDGFQLAVHALKDLPEIFRNRLENWVDFIGSRMSFGNIVKLPSLYRRP
jgi:hypothetical protein